MNTYMQRIGMGVAGILAAMSIWACAATRNADGSFTLKFAPDMTITAWGLEDGLSKINDLLRDCIAGTFHRPCTPEELKEIRMARRDILRVKDRLPPPG
jgi:hypothetical protein